jgi:hypothetical protein
LSNDLGFGPGEVISQTIRQFAHGGRRYEETVIAMQRPSPNLIRTPRLLKANYSDLSIVGAPVYDNYVEPESASLRPLLHYSLSV